MPVTPETAAIPVAVTAADLAVRLNMPERTLRRKAREFGTCRILGRTMFFLPEDVHAFKVSSDSPQADLPCAA